MHIFLSAAVVVFAAAAAAVSPTCDNVSTACSLPFNCSEAVERAMLQAHFIDGHVHSGTSPQHPAVVMPVTHLRYIPDLKVRMTLTRARGGGVLQWWLEWAQPYALETTNRTLVHGHLLIEGVEIDWQGGGCTHEDLNMMKSVFVGAIANVCVKVQGGDGLRNGQDQEEQHQLCFQESGVIDMLQLQPPSHAEREHYEFFLFFHFIVKPFCRLTDQEKCWASGSDEDLGTFKSLQDHKLYTFFINMEFVINDCSSVPSSKCSLRSRRIEDVAFFATFHSAPGRYCTI
jgi:hypothetical protein